MQLYISPLNIAHVWEKQTRRKYIWEGVKRDWEERWVYLPKKSGRSCTLQDMGGVGRIGRRQVDSVYNTHRHAHTMGGSADKKDWDNLRWKDERGRELD